MRKMGSYMISERDKHRCDGTDGNERNGDEREQ